MTDASTLHVVCPHCTTTNRVPREKLEKGGKCGHCHQPLFDGHPVALTEENFPAHSKGDLPLVIDFWAEWCGPCRVMAPAFEQAAREMEPHVRFAKVDTDEVPRLAGMFSIRGIPTLVLLSGGREVARVSGAMPANKLVAWIRQNLGG